MFSNSEKECSTSVYPSFARVACTGCAIQGFMFSRSNEMSMEFSALFLQVACRARATQGFMQQSRIARNAYTHQMALAADAVEKAQQRYGVKPGERLQW